MIAVLLLILKILLLILGVAVLLVLFALFVPVSVQAQYRPDSTWVRLNVLFLKFTLYPQAEKPEKKEKPKKKKPPKKKTGKGDSEKKAAPKKSSTKKLTPDKLRVILSTVGSGMKKIFKGLHFEHIKVLWPVHAREAADTAFLYGSVYGSVSGLLAVANNLFDLQFDSFRLEPDFTGEMQQNKHLSCKITTHLFIMVVTGIYAFFRLRNEKII